MPLEQINAHLYVYIHTYIQTSTHTHTHLHTHPTTEIHPCTLQHTHTHTNAYMDIHINIYICVCVSVFRENIKLYLRELLQIVTELTTGNYTIIRLPEGGAAFMETYGGTLRDNLEAGHRLCCEIYKDKELYDPGFLQASMVSLLVSTHIYASLFMSFNIDCALFALVVQLGGGACMHACKYACMQACMCVFSFPSLHHACSRMHSVCMRARCWIQHMQQKRRACSCACKARC